MSATAGQRRYRAWWVESWGDQPDPDNFDPDAVEYGSAVFAHQSSARRHAETQSQRCGTGDPRVYVEDYAPWVDDETGQTVPDWEEVEVQFYDDDEGAWWWVDLGEVRPIQFNRTGEIMQIYSAKPGETRLLSPRDNCLILCDQHAKRDGYRRRDIVPGIEEETDATCIACDGAAVLDDEVLTDQIDGIVACVNLSYEPRSDARARLHAQDICRGMSPAEEYEVEEWLCNRVDDAVADRWPNTQSSR
jgi:hypothetical protein